MRLLNAETLEVEDGFFEKNTPPYAILSHTWGVGEVVLQDLDDRIAATRKAGYRKIEGTCSLALKDGLRYVWIDTCCIDKLSSAELSEAINSMFRWYQNAAVCYVYLSDVNSGLTDDRFPSQFRRSRWFTRGWTLQELIAPRQCIFLNSDWDHLSDRAGLSHSISEITGIDQKYLRSRGRDEVGIQPLLSQASVAERMSWASARQTTRVEDIAYSLLGIFGVNMPLLYGEGEKAFLRLQHTIAGQSSDQTLFAWSHSPGSLPGQTNSGIFATSPSAFASSANLVPFDDMDDIAPFSVTNRGLYITLPIKNGSALLQCRHRDDISTVSTIVLRNIRGQAYVRAETDLVGTVNYQAWENWDKKTVYVSTDAGGFQGRGEDGFVVRNLPQGFDVSGAHVGRVIPFRDQLSWKLGAGERFEDAVILRQGGFEARLTLCAWRASRSFTSGRNRRTRVGYYFATGPKPAPTSINTSGLKERFSAVAHPQGMLQAAITHEDVLGKNIFFVDIDLVTNPVSATWLRLSTATGRTYHRAVVRAANATPAAFSVPLVDVVEKMTAFVDSLCMTLAAFWIPWIIYSLLFWMMTSYASYANPEHKDNAYIPLSFDQRRLFLVLLYEGLSLGGIVVWESLGTAYEASYSRNAGVELYDTLWLTEFILPSYKSWVHLSIVFIVSFVLQAAIPSWVLTSPMIVILGCLFSIVGLLLTSLWSRSAMESVMRHMILVRDQSDGTEASDSVEASGKEKDTSSGKRGKGVSSD